MCVLSLASISLNSPKYQTIAKPNIVTPVKRSQRSKGNRSVGSGRSIVASVIVAFHCPELQRDTAGCGRPVKVGAHAITGYAPRAQPTARRRSSGLLTHRRVEEPVQAPPEPSGSICLVIEPALFSRDRMRGKVDGRQIVRSQDKAMVARKASAPNSSKPATPSAASAIDNCGVKLTT